MHAAIKRIKYEMYFALYVFTVIPASLFLAYFTITVDIFKKAPHEIEKHLKDKIYGK
jgi:hypothetical protein